MPLLFATKSHEHTSKRKDKQRERETTDNVSFAIYHNQWLVVQVVQYGFIHVSSRKQKLEHGTVYTEAVRRA